MSQFSNHFFFLTKNKTSEYDQDMLKSQTNPRHCEEETKKAGLQTQGRKNTK